MSISVDNVPLFVYIQMQFSRKVLGSIESFRRQGFEDDEAFKAAVLSVIHRLSSDCNFVWLDIENSSNER